MCIIAPLHVPRFEMEVLALMNYSDGSHRRFEATSTKYNYNKNKTRFFYETGLIYFLNISFK